MDTEENVYFSERDEKDYRWMNKHLKYHYENNPNFVGIFHIVVKINLLSCFLIYKNKKKNEISQ